MNKLPKARTENLLEQNLEKETLIYDLTIDKAFNLNETLSIVYKACGGNQTFDEIRRKHKFTDDFIYLALDELKRNKLLADESYVSPFAQTSRREVIKKVGLATMFALPIITGLIAPKAVNAASGGAAARRNLNDSCSYGFDERCDQGLCFGTTNGDACCNPSNGLPIRGGSTYSTTGGDDATNPTYTFAAPGATAPTCAGTYNCCNVSQTPYGSCSYDYIEPYTGNDPQFQGYYLARLECTCSCP
jgi:hypothetical protein